MPSFTRSAVTNADGNSVSQADTVTGGESAKVTLTLEAGVSGSLTTRTDANTGVITVAAHSLTTADFCSVFWTDTSGVEKCHENMDITAVTSTTISVDLGQGDDLPTALTAVIVSKVASRVVAWDGTANGMLGFAASVGNRRASVTAQEVGTLIGLASTDRIKHLKTTSPGDSWLSGVDGAFTFTTDILMLTAAIGDVNGAAVATFVRLDT